MMESDSRYSCIGRHAGMLSLSLSRQGQAAGESISEDALNLRLNSWGQAVHPICFDRDKSNNGCSPHESAADRGGGNATSSRLQNVASSEEGLNMIGSEKGFCLSLSLASAFAGRSNSSRCDGLAHDSDMHTDGDERGLINVDLGLGLNTSRECHSTVAPFLVGDAPFMNSKEIYLQLGLSESSLSLDSDSVSLDVQDAQAEASTYDHIPVVDEGSTSARLMESGGNFVPFLEKIYAKENPSGARSQAHARMMSMGASEADALKLSTSREVPADMGGFIGASERGGKAPFGGDAASGTLHGHGAWTSNASCPMAERGAKKCKFTGCSKGARGASGLCIAHGGGRRCQKLNCNKGAEGRTMFCKAHGGGRRCQRLGCIKSAEGRTDFCIAHGGGRRCMYEGCGKAARGRSGLCIRHGGGKRCQREGCTKSAEGYSGLCISHGGGRRCQFPNCGKGAQGSTKFCKGHGGGRRCEFEGCCKGAEGSTSFCKAHGGGKRCSFGGGTCTKSVHGGTAFCVAHGGGKRCSVSGCTKSARGRTDFCVRHGGGKRCKFDHCNKSAQGSTDYCKAHGGGRRCSWGQEGSVYDGSLLDPASICGLKASSCEKFARGKAGLCSAHITLLEQLYPALASVPDPQSACSEQAFSKRYPQPLSDVSEPTSQLDEEPESMVENQLKSAAEGSCGLQEQISGPVVFKAQFASRRCVAATDASRQDMGDGCSVRNSHSRECSTSNVSGLNIALCHRSVGNTPTLPTSKPLQRDFVMPSSQIQTKVVCSDALQQFTDSVRHESWSENPEERVHGAGHFMEFCLKKTSGDHQ